jgi:hypothetical protein
VTMVAYEDRQALDSLDLKSTLVTKGVRYPRQVYDAVSPRARLEPPENPYACNCFILPGEVAVHLHANEQSPFALEVDGNGRVSLTYDGDHLAVVEFPDDCGYYRQNSAAGHPFGSLAVLEGRGTLAFFYLWTCDYIRTGETCPFCFQVRADMAGYPLPSPTDEEVAQVIGWAIEHAGVTEVQLTAGTRFNSKSECERYARLIRVIDEQVGLKRIPSELYCYMTAPKEPSQVDLVIEAGASRVAHDLHVWDRDLHARYAPGHARHIGRDGQLRALQHISDKYGPNRAFSAFVAGLEPLDSMLEGAEYLARRGIVPAFSIWMPPDGSTTENHKPPGVEYYRQARREFARLYREFGLDPPGVPAGSNVSMCRDIYRHMNQILGDS